MDVAKDVAKLFNLPDSKITYVKDRAFNDQCASLHLVQLSRVRATLGFARCIMRTTLSARAYFYLYQTMHKQYRNMQYWHKHVHLQL